MRQILLFLLCCPVLSNAQDISGTFNGSGTTLTLKADHTFNYYLGDTLYYSWLRFSGKGIWTLSGDTLSLNPSVSERSIAGWETEAAAKNSDSISLTFHHIARYYDRNENLLRTDTTLLEPIDFSLNIDRRKYRKRITSHFQVHCFYGGYIPDEIITTEPTITVAKPSEPLKRIFIRFPYFDFADYEYNTGNPALDHFTFNYVIGHYEDELLPGTRFLIKNKDQLQELPRTSSMIYNGRLLKLKRVVRN